MTSFPGFVEFCQFSPGLSYLSLSCEKLLGTNVDIVWIGRSVSPDHVSRAAAFINQATIAYDHHDR